MSETTYPGELLTVEQVSRRLQVSRATTYRRIHDGELQAVRVGEDGPIRVPTAALEELLRPARVNA